MPLYLARRKSLWGYLNDIVTTKIAAAVDGAALANSTVATSLLAAASKVTILSEVFEVGRSFRIKAAGRVSNIVTTPGTLTLDVRFVDSAGTVIVANGGAMGLNIVAKTNVSWFLEWLLTVRSIGSGTSATLMHQGKWTSESVVGSPLPSAGGSGTLLLPASAPAVGTGFNSQVEQLVDLFATFSIANAGNSIQLHQFSVEIV